MKTTFEQFGGTYRIENGYRIPNLTLPDDEPEYEIGIWDRRRFDYLKNHKKGLFSAMLMSGKLNQHIHEIDLLAYERHETIVRQMMVSQGVTEQLKAGNQMEWVGRVNNICACADEIVRDELIYG
ncbi:MAG: TnpV protein [Oscillospiraceae bacterium]|nr:TnpV protein [Oscillospiraceae bacterium]